MRRGFDRWHSVRIGLEDGEENCVCVTLWLMEANDEATDIHGAIGVGEMWCLFLGILAEHRTVRGNLLDIRDSSTLDVGFVFSTFHIP